MATPPDSPIIEESTLIELEEQLNNPSAFQHARPVALEDLCRQTKFTRQEIRIMYRGFKQVSNTDKCILIYAYIFLYIYKYTRVERTRSFTYELVVNEFLVVGFELVHIHYEFE